ncbi:MAG: Fur family transcriptional regulator, peroxide stress response regulator [Frankiales bacterium]|jgi:Fur family ferric uptake transcriptional regulator/Fur family peroxide stress response transcriptional regulator|nr:Fur family transcriptional regulator, peroxide stress response regulator [Frankiales bacterium]
MPTTGPELRLTPQRRAVLEVLRGCTDHPTAAEVIDRVRHQHPGIGAATVYRSLGLLVESGQALELSLGDGASARYDGNTTHHDHVVCDTCGRAVDVPRLTASPITTAARGIAHDTGFDVTGYDLRFHGLCADCQRLNGATAEA